MAEIVWTVPALEQLDDLAQYIALDKPAAARALVAKVVAVNQAWGFVVVDAGQRLGITEATKLLVTRGNKTVGKLSIVSVQNERTVANILPETLAGGLNVAPGDRVILENLFQ